MKSRTRNIRLTNHAIATARPKASEYTLWDSTLNHFGLRVYPSGVRSFIVQVRVQGRMRKITLGQFPATGIAEARKQAATLLARIWSGEPIAPVRKPRAPLFRDFAVRYRARRKGRWKPSSLETFDIYLRNRLMPHFGRLTLDTIDHARVSAWFDAASAEKPGAANRAFEILRAMLNAARQWGELGESVPDACANIVKNKAKPVARYLNREELNRLGTVLDRHEQDHPWPVAAIRLLTLTGARLSEVLHLRWGKIGELSENGATARLTDSKTGPRTIWLGPDAARLLARLPRDEHAVRIFPEAVTSDRLYRFWCEVREQAGLSGLRIHDCRTHGLRKASSTASVLPPSGDCSDIAGAAPPPSTPISTIPPCGTPRRKPRSSSPGPCDTRHGRSRTTHPATATTNYRIGRSRNMIT